MVKIYIKAMPPRFRHGSLLAHVDFYLDCFTKLCKAEAEPVNILEVGPFEGYGLRLWIERARELDKLGEVHAIDPMNDVSVGPTNNKDEIHEWFQRNIMKPYPFVKFHRIDSLEVAKNPYQFFGNTKFNFILLDGMHSFEVESSDLLMASGLLRARHILILDDIHDADSNKMIGFAEQNIKRDFIVMRGGSDQIVFANGIEIEL
jgi:hypothetical protein